MELVREMIAHRAPETIGLGIDYRENDHEPENFWKAFMMASKRALKSPSTLANLVATGAMLKPQWTF